jgi:isoleucyl-tRNA synthetase
MSFAIPYDQWKDIQRDILDSTRQTAQSTLNAVSTLLTLLTVCVAGFTAIGGFIGFKLYGRLANAARRADLLVTTVENVENTANNLKSELSQQFTKLREQTNQETLNFREQIKNYSSELTTIHNNLTSLTNDMTLLNKNIQEFDKWKKTVKSDLQYMLDSITIINLEERSLALLGDDPLEIKQAVEALIQITDVKYKSIFRRRSVDMLGQFVLKSPKNDNAEDIINCLRKVAKDDHASSVRRIAEDVIKKLGE